MITTRPEAAVALYFGGAKSVYACMYAILGHKFNPYCLKANDTPPNTGPEPPLHVTSILAA